MQPLYAAATKKSLGKKFVDVWAEQGLQRNFDDVKRLLMNACTLSHSDPAAPLALTVDASQFAIGGTLEQMIQGVWQPLGFWLRHLAPNQVKWSCFRRELYAIQQGICYFMDEINGRQLVVFSDYLPIIGAFKNP